MESDFKSIIEEPIDACLVSSITLPVIENVCAVKNVNEQKQNIK